MDEHDPVEDSEFVYRRIHCNDVNAKAPFSIQMTAFRPTPNDTTGLSFFRSAFVQPTETLANIDSSKAKSYYVARLSVLALRTLGLTVLPDPVSPGPPGHTLIPELTRMSYMADKQHWKPILVELARLASADIVHQPQLP